MTPAGKHRVVTNFMIESNLIEGLVGAGDAEVIATLEFLERGELSVSILEGLAISYEEKATLRDSRGMDVRVGNHYPPQGGPGVLHSLTNLLRDAMNEVSRAGSAHEIHKRYEDLHPFMDGNGRSGRTLWAWMMIRQYDWEHTFALPFLHRWYYQSLEFGRVNRAF